MPTDAERLADALDPYRRDADPALVAALDSSVPGVPTQSAYLANLGVAPTVQSTGGTVQVATPLGQALGDGMADALMAPGRAFTGEMQVRDPQTGALTHEATDWGAGTALGMMGGSSIPRVSVAAGEMAVGSGPIRAYHGSPHDFDRFDLSKIGTGEGAQAYGHGLYFAENKGVAQSYRDALSKPSPGTAEYDAWKALQDFGGDRQQAADYLSGLTLSRPGRAPYLLPNTSQAVEMLKADAPVAGRMYEVAIHADPQRFLDWDRPLAEQPGRVREILSSPEGMGLKPLETQRADGANISAWVDPITGRPVGPINVSRGSSTPNLPTSLFHENSAGPTLYNSVGSSPAARSALLEQAGIPGIKYLDEVSRGIGSGTSNYVVFDDKIVDILKKYGVASVAALPPAVQASLGIGQQQNPAQLDPSAPQT